MVGYSVGGTDEPQEGEKWGVVGSPPLLEFGPNGKRPTVYPWRKRGVNRTRCEIPGAIGKSELTPLGHRTFFGIQGT